MLAVLPLVPVVYVAGAAAVGMIAGWLKGRSTKRKAEALEELRRLDHMGKTMEEIRVRQRQQQAQHEADLAATDAGDTEPTEEEQAFQAEGFAPQPPATDALDDLYHEVAARSEDAKKEKKKEEEEDNYTGDDRFELMDL